MNNTIKTTVSASNQAATLIEQLKKEHGELIFHLSGGCCDGSAPMCFAKNEFIIGSVDILVGNVCGCPFYIAESTLTYYQNNHITLDVTKGCGASFSIEAPLGMRFLICSKLIKS